MAKKKETEFTVAGPFPAYDKEPGTVVELDPDDPGVAANLAAGVITKGKTDPPAPATVTCPACEEAGTKDPPSFTSQEELAAHYADAHPALAAPEWKEGDQR